VAVGLSKSWDVSLSPVQVSLNHMEVMRTTLLVAYSSPFQENV